MSERKRVKPHKKREKPVGPETNEPVRALVILYAGETVESIWVRKIRGRRYEVCTIPYFAYNMSLGDIVQCGPDEDGIGLFVEQVLKKSGNRTVRVGFEVAEGGRHPEAKKFRRFLQRHGIEYDYDDAGLISINVPSDEVYEKIQKRLKKMPENAQMIWEDGDPQPERNLDGTDQEPVQS